MSSYRNDATATVRLVEERHAREGFKAPAIEVRFAEAREFAFLPPLIYIKDGRLFLDVNRLFVLPAQKRYNERPIKLVIEEQDGSRSTVGPFPASRLFGLINPKLNSVVAAQNSLVHYSGEVIEELTEDELRAEISRVLGRHFLESAIIQRGGSWLLEESLSAKIVRGGIEMFFYHLFMPLSETSDDIWVRYENDASAASWLINRGGPALIAPFLSAGSGGQSGLLWLIANRPDFEDGAMISRLPQYIKEAPLRILDELEASLGPR